MTISHFENASNSNGTKPKRTRKSKSNANTLSKKEKGLDAKLTYAIEKGDDWVELTLPIVTVSEANGGVKKSFKRNGKTCYKSEHWTKKHRRHRLQKGSVALLLRPHRSELSLPCKIKLTRYGPAKLDRFDNLPMSMKYVLDAVCEILTDDYRPGRADGHEGIESVEYDQVVSQSYGVKLRIQSVLASSSVSNTCCPAQ